jgi:hypothetical protein
MTNTEKESKRAKLAKLLALAADTANEHAANAAMAKALEMAEAYGLSLDDIAKGNAASKDYIRTGPQFSSFRSADRFKSFYPVDFFLSFALAAFCDVKFKVCADADGDNAIEYFGHSIDVDITLHLRKVIGHAMIGEWKAYEMFDTDGMSERAKETARYSFMQGMAARLRVRMLELKNDSNARHVAEDGRSLVVVKAAELARKASEVGFAETAKGSAYNRAQDYEAGRAGNDAGNRVPLRSAVASGGARMMRIGK